MISLVSPTLGMMIETYPYRSDECELLMLCQTPDMCQK